MKSKLALAALAAVISIPSVAPFPAVAKTYRNGHHTYYGHRYRCKRSSGTTGAIAGAAGGALVASALGGGTLGTIAGAGGGALLGKHLDQKHDAAQNRRNGC